MSDGGWLADTDEGVRLRIYARPRASRTQACGLHGDRLKIQLASPPVDGQANAALIEFLSDTLSVGKNDVTITAGVRGKRKTVLVCGRTGADVLDSDIGTKVKG